MHHTNIFAIKIFMKSSNLQFISGPLNWFHFLFTDDNGNSKQIHLFSDIHELTNLCPQSLKCKNNNTWELKKSKCYEVDYFFEKIFQKSIRDKIYTDFFLESPYRIYQEELQINPNKNYLDLINHRFEKCLTRKKKGCKYLPYVKMHYTDVRIPDYNYITMGSFILEMYLLLIENLYFYAEDKISKIELDNMVNLFNIIFDWVTKNAEDISIQMMTENNFEKSITSLFQPVLDWMDMNRSQVIIRAKYKLEQMLNQLFSLVKIRNNKRVFVVKHQIDQLRKDNIKYNGKNMADLILSFFVEFTNILSEKAKKLNYEYWHGNKFSSKLLNLKSKSESKQLAKILWNQRSTVLRNNILFDLTYLDAYILARMFRKFDGVFTNQAIVYAGDMHIESQKYFFTIYLGLEPIHVETNKEGERCLSNINFNKIFFEN
jgi:hypothetical protein